MDTETAARHHWHVGTNTVGYIPDNDPKCYDTPGDALIAWNTEVTSTLEALPEDRDDLYLEADTERNSAGWTPQTVAVTGGISQWINVGRSLFVNHWIEMVDPGMCDAAPED